jgi:type IV pilus assembly protein PilY1
MNTQQASTLGRRLVAALVTATAGLVVLGTAPAHAEDIDLYSGTGGAVAAPNVLFFLDNSSNWSAASQAWSKVGALAKCSTGYPSGSVAQTRCLAYVEQVFGSDSSLLQGQVELRALRLVLSTLVCGSGSTLRLNAGTMLFNPNGTADGNSVMAGYLRQRVAPMDATRCAEMLADLDAMDAKITTPDFKGPSSAEYGAPLYEAFKYFGGYARPPGSGSGSVVADATHYGPVRYSRPTHLEDPLAFLDAAKTTYAGPAGGSSCGGNYIILIGNTWPNQEYGTDTNAAPSPTNLLLGRLGHDPGAQIYPRPLANSDKSDVRFADEWARFLYSADLDGADGQQNIRMFTIDVYNRMPDAAQGALLKSMADTNGPGGYYSVGGDLYGLIAAFTDVLTQIASINSVFASASLPVSVNTQGTFLNQVFMGVFRPDGDGNQRWAGNLKQYKFARSGNTLYLADANGVPAVDSVSTGFIQNCATSFWTVDSGDFWQSVTGSVAASCNSTTGSPYSDAPDGPLVERGGAAQRLRNLGHAARNIRTCRDASCRTDGDWRLVNFNTANVPSVPGLGEAESARLVDWARGVNNGDGTTSAAGTLSYTDYGLGPTATRPTVHGEVVHSRPLAINYGTSGTGDDVVVFYGAGDGMLRAVSGNQTGADAGSELWAFIAPEHWSKLNRVRINSPRISYPDIATGLIPLPAPKSYFFDGAIGGYQERNSSTVSRTWIFPAMRRGGTSVYAFDVSSRPGPTAQPRLMWKFSAADHAAMGQSWSTPLAIRVKGRSAPLVVFGAGYDACEDSEEPNTACAGVGAGRGIFVLNAALGPTASAEFRFIDPGADAGRFAADVAPVDVDGDGYVDVLYAVDTRGNVWRINTSDPAAGFTGYTNVADWPVQKIATVGQWGASRSERRKFMYAPSAVVLGMQTTVLVGSGDREKPSAGSLAAQVLNRFYGIRDDVSATSGVVPAVGYGANPADFYDATDASSLDPLAMASYRGWFISLSTTSPPYEQVVTTPLTIAGVTYFSTYQAMNPGGPRSCTNLGTARAYQVDFQTGTPLPGEPVMKPFLSQGIPPSPVGGVVRINGILTPFLIGGTAPTVLSPTRIIPKVKPNRKPIYRYERVDG